MGPYGCVSIAEMEVSKPDSWGVLHLTNDRAALEHLKVPVLGWGNWGHLLFPVCPSFPDGEVEMQPKCSFPKVL